MNSEDINVLIKFLEGKVPLKLAFVSKKVIYNVIKITNEKIPTALLDDGTWCDLYNCSLNDFIVYGNLSEIKGNSKLTEKTKEN